MIGADPGRRLWGVNAINAVYKRRFEARLWFSGALSSLRRAYKFPSEMNGSRRKFKGAS